jgi:protoporphyrinogen oxidase
MDGASGSWRHVPVALITKSQRDSSGAGIRAADKRLRAKTSTAPRPGADARRKLAMKSKSEQYVSEQVLIELAERPRVVVIGGGFGGLAAAYELASRSIRPTVVEQDASLGGLAGSFQAHGARLEKFYHHWFTSDQHVVRLLREINAQDRIVYRRTATGMYFANQCYRLSTPLDLLRFTPLRATDRVRLGLSTLRARSVRHWRRLEGLTAAEWLTSVAGENVYRSVWEPLLRGKFGPYAGEVSAVWFWNKLKLRGGSRGRGGRELLGYYRGGFAGLADRIALEISARGGEIRTQTAATSLLVREGRVWGVRTNRGEIEADAVIATPALPIIADLVKPHVSQHYLDRLRKIRYLANLCLVLELDRSLSSTYWLNVTDPYFPFVAVIEHTNFEPAETYGGRHIVYLSKYLPDSDPLYLSTDDEVLDYCVPYLSEMFPALRADWIRAHHVWRAPYAQPIVVRHYGEIIPEVQSPLAGFYIATMAQIYPEDRGTNYAIRDGRRAACAAATALAERSSTHP